MTERNLNTQDDTEKLFLEVSRAMREQDSLKMNELMAAKEEEAPVVETEQPEAADTEETTDATASEDTTESEDSKNDSPPEDPSAEVVDTKGKEEEPDDLVKLKEQLANVKEENHRLKSQAGRVPSLQRKQQDLEKKLNQLLKSGLSPSTQTTPQLSQKARDNLKKLEESDPVLARTLEELLLDQASELHRSANSGANEVLQVLTEKEALELADREMGKLLNLYPNAVDVFNSPQWSEYVKELPEQWQTLAGSMYAEDVAAVFERYKNDMMARHPELAEQKPTSPASKSEPSAKAKQVQETRERKLDAPVVKSTTQTPKGGTTDDPESLFKKYYAEVQKRDNLVRQR